MFCIVSWNIYLANKCPLGRQTYTHTYISHIKSWHQLILVDYILFIFLKIKLGSEVLSALLVPSPLTVASVGIQTLSSWPRVRISCIILHCPLLSLFSSPSILLRAETRRQTVVALFDVNWKYECPTTQIFCTLWTSFFKVYFIEFAITVGPFFLPLYSPLPCTHPAVSIPHPLAHVHGLFI